MLIPYMVICFIFGALFYFTKNIILISAVLSALFLTFYLGKRSLALFLAAFFVFGYISSYFQNEATEHKINKLMRFNKVEGYVVDKYNNNVLITNFKENYKILVNLKQARVGVGDYLIVNSNILLLPNYSKRFYYSKGIIAKANIINFKIQERNNIITFLIKNKYRLIEKLLDIDKISGAFLSGILFGYTKNIEDDYYKIFDELGITHILAVSGFNLGIIYLFFNKIFSNFSYILRKILTLCICFIFVFIAAFEASILRAFIMIVFLNIARFLKRPSSSINNLFLAMLLMLIRNIFLIFNGGFIFSFGATLGILLLNSYFKKYNDDISASISTFLFTFPIVLLYRGYFSLLSLMINILISPFVAFLTVASFISTTLYFIFEFDFILYFPLYLGRIFINFLKVIQDYNVLFYFNINYVTLFSYYFLIIINFVFVKLKNKRILNYVLGSILLLSILYKPNNLLISFINVGQGDSIFIETPNRHCILIDTGPSYLDYLAAESKVVPFIKKRGYNKIDLFIITHPHKDHFSGFDYILKNFHVKRVAASFKISNVDFLYLVKGDKILVDNVELDVLYPQNIIYKDDKNENALVLSLKYKDFSMLLPSDADLDNIDLESKVYDIIQLPHHGSINSMGLDTIKNYHFRNAIISVGKNNFGHPSVLLLDYLKDSGIKFYRTDVNGNILISTNGKKYFVKGDWNDSE